MRWVLVVEDEVRIASFVQKGLRANGFGCEAVGDGREALELMRTGKFDLVVLDVGLPSLDGFSVLRRLRTEKIEVPVIMLTARDGLDDTLAGLDGGADDYMRKPFAFEELLARIRLRLRGASPSEATQLRAGDLALDLRTRRAQVEGRTVDLTTREFLLLEVFLRHPDAVLTREQLLTRVWGFDFDPGSNVVDVYVRYLRGKIGNERIETVRGAGYRLRPDAAIHSM